LEIQTNEPIDLNEQIDLNDENYDDCEANPKSIEVMLTQFLSESGIVLQVESTILNASSVTDSHEIITDSSSNFFDHGLDAFITGFNHLADGYKRNPAVIWQKSENSFVLTREELDILKFPGRWAQDNMISSALFLIKKEFKNVFGLIPLHSFANDGQPRVNLQTPKNGLFAQIINTGGHYVTLCGFFTEKGIKINVYDSMNYAFRSRLNPLNARMIRYLSAMLKNHESINSTNNTIEMTFCEVSAQQAGECGFNAVANLLAFLNFIDPIQIAYHENIMRDHLSNIFQSDQLNLFPYELLAKPRETKTFKSVNLLICQCKKGHHNLNENLVRCINCNDTYHQSCWINYCSPTRTDYCNVCEKQSTSSAINLF
jgi:hypothetical protein